MKFMQYLRCAQTGKSLSSVPRVHKGEFITVLDTIFPKAYQPAAVEKDVYDNWEKNCCFSSGKKNSNKFSLVLPPPNITGTLHLGHTLTVAIQDSLVRWQRMEGKDTVWIPGLDHAGIATQTVVERWLKKEKNKSRHDLGREEFLNEVSNWRNEKGNTIKEQLRTLGASLEWSRELFTMDPRHNEAVTEALVQLWDKGLVYRKKSLINWSCELSSAISDIEVERLEVSGPTEITVPGYDKPVKFGEMMEFAYKVCGSEEDVVVSTTRVETMLGDVAVAVHPDDNRYRHLHNSSLWHPFRSKTIPVICDSAVDMEFGTGAVKITPGHSHTDWEISERHKLPLISVINEKGCITSCEGMELFQGMKRFDAKESIKNELARLGLLKSIKPHAMQVPVCSRSGDVVEYLLKPQWFISFKEMAAKASAVVKEGMLDIDPPNFKVVWFNWLDKPDIKDWCISRQLWWGHQMPMYLATRGDSQVWVAASSLSQAVTKAAAKLGGEPETVSQDPDVLDTWFSSALYPFSALGWPNKTDDFNQYYPLSVMETGHDILFFWVARMVMLAQELTGQLPFKKICLHGIICDSHGRKMSKSLGNVINPEDVIKGISLQDLNDQVKKSHRAGLLSAQEMKLAIQGQQKLFPSGIPECGTDALRFTLLSHNTKSDFINFDVKECETNHHFCNKIWQASKFALHWASYLHVSSCEEPSSPQLMDRWVLSQLSNSVHSVTAALQSVDLYQATDALKQFLYYTFCDIYIEAAKPILRDGSDKEAINTCQTLLHCLDVSLRLASPVMPFICEQLYKHLPGNQDKSAMMANFPCNMEKWVNSDIDSTVGLGIDVLLAVRSMRATNGFSKRINVPVEVETLKEREILEMKSVIEHLANCTLRVSSKSSQVRHHTLTNTLGDHTLIHILLKSVSQEQRDDYLKILNKKEEKIKKNLDNMIEKCSKKSYEKRTNEEIRRRHLEIIKQLEEELKVIRSYLDKAKQELQ